MKVINHLCTNTQQQVLHYCAAYLHVECEESYCVCLHLYEGHIIDFRLHGDLNDGKSCKQVL